MEHRLSYHLWPFPNRTLPTTARKNIFFFLSNIEECERLLRFLQLGLEGGDVSGEVAGVRSRGKLSQCVIVNLWFDSPKWGYRLPLLISTYRTAATRLTLNQPVTCNAAGWWILHTAFKEVTFLTLYREGEERHGGVQELGEGVVKVGTKAAAIWASNIVRRKESADDPAVRGTPGTS